MTLDTLSSRLWPEAGLPREDHHCQCSGVGGVRGQREDPLHVGWGMGGAQASLGPPPPGFQEAPALNQVPATRRNAARAFP